MRITHCLLSCDSNPEYLDFWPVVAKAWLKLGIQPVLFYISTNKDRFPAEVADCPVHGFEPIPGISLRIQYSSLRYWGCVYYPNDIVIVGEMDLIPLSKKFFIDRLHDSRDASYIHVPPAPRPDYGVMTADEILHEHPIDKAHYLNAVYHIARGDTMKRILDFSDSWEESCRKMVPYWFKLDRLQKVRPCEHQIDLKSSEAYYGDEVYPTIKVALAQQQGEQVELLSYSEKEYDWICRIPPSPNRGLPEYSEEKLRAGYYSATHVPRPYGKHQVAIDRLLALNDSLHPSG